MRLTQNIYLVGGGTLGFGLSDELDCHVYLVDGGSAYALIDAGVGRNIDLIVQRIIEDGLDPEKLKYLLLTHAHSDHAGGSAEWRKRFGMTVVASPVAAQYVRDGDEEKISLATAKQGGFYPADYHFSACEVSTELREGDSFQVGNLELQALETSGHCSGMLSYLLEDQSRKILFSGDSVFHGGRILMTNVWDCSVPEYVKTVEKLAGLNVDVLLPGHLTIAMSQGNSHIQQAWQTMQRLSLPANIV
jgi:glyoxylase-like metal-dependent hydrolase (beta-lactamase superfamily II)